MKCILCGMKIEYSARAVHDHFIDHHEDIQTGMAEYIIALQKKIEEIESNLEKSHGPNG
jgi:Mg2+ and Co2+ transporter CorA